GSTGTPPITQKNPPPPQPHDQPPKDLRRRPLSPDMVFTGIEAICETVERQWQMFPAMSHGTVNLDVDVEAATGRSDVIVHIQLQDTTWVTGGATYLDEYRRHDGAWRIARRTVTRTFNVGPIPNWGPPGER
ncbi:nuclear transport factor 2 family protein, partial [Streptomyces mirabilis]|uniref:nuclear transport factor 2 family protein n=1 Tax=Streptomyces mirabilis TaxID=68239 RepID=UPI0033B24FFB